MVQDVGEGAFQSEAYPLRDGEALRQAGGQVNQPRADDGADA